MRLGAHVSIAGGIGNAVTNAVVLGCESFQIFPWSPRIWSAKPYNDEALAAFRADKEAAGLKELLVHNIYLINLASPNPQVARLSRDAFLKITQFADRIGADGVVIHIGMNPDKKTGQLQVAALLKEALSKTETGLFLENSSGQKSSVGSSFSDIKTIMGLAGDHPRLGLLIDTCHAFQAGYALHTAEGFGDFTEELRAEIGLDRVRGFHLNDSRYPFSQARDVHENIGEGELGLEAFRRVLAYPAFEDLPGVLEIPGADGRGPDEKNLAVLRALQ